MDEWVIRRLSFRGLDLSLACATHLSARVRCTFASSLQHYSRCCTCLPCNNPPTPSPFLSCFFCHSNPWDLLVVEFCEVWLVWGREGGWRRSGFGSESRVGIWPFRLCTLFAAKLQTWRAVTIAIRSTRMRSTPSL